MDFHAALWWLFFNFLSLVVLAFFSMQEMACVSFNKIRLHYYVSKEKKRADWLNFLIQNPSRLFGTTLICVNVAMLVGSECAREFYEALGVSPDLAPLSQVIIVIIFAELAPMFAARRYAEHVALLGAPIVYGVAKVLSPFLWSISSLSKLINRVIGGKEDQPEIVLNQDDLQGILEELDEERVADVDNEDFDVVALNIFGIRNKNADHLMKPLSSVPSFSKNAAIGAVRHGLRKSSSNYISVYHRSITNIIGITSPRDLIRAPDTKRVREFAKPPWFITQGTKAMQILHQFRRNNENVAVVLDPQGHAIGILLLEDLLEEIFGRTIKKKTVPVKEIPAKLVIDRTFPGDLLVADFNKQFDVVLDSNQSLTLAELVTKILGHQPEVDESIFISPFELTVKETSLLEIKSISVTTHL